MKLFKIFTFSAAAIILIFISIGIISPSTTYTIEMNIDAEPSRTFEYFTSSSKLPYWLSGYSHSEIIRGDGQSDGSVVKQFFNGTQETFYFENTIIEVNPNSVYRYDMVNEMMESNTTIVFGENAPGSTFVKVITKVTGKGLITRSMFPLIKSKMVKQSTADYRKLKRLIESGK